MADENIIDLKEKEREIIDSINLDFYITKDLITGCKNENFTNGIIQHLSYNNMYVLMIKLIDFIDYRNSRHADDVRFPYHILSGSDQNKLEAFYNQYQIYRNKKLAHNTDLTINATLTIEDLEPIINIINSHRIGAYSTGGEYVAKIFKDSGCNQQLKRNLL